MKENGFKHGEFERQLGRLGIKSSNDLKIGKIWNKNILDKLLQEMPVPPNSDYYPVLDTNAVRARFLDTNANIFFSPLKEPLPVMEMLGMSDTSWMDHDVTPRDDVLKSQRVHVARAVRSYYLHGRFDEKYGPITAEMRDHAAGMERLFKTCGAGMSEHERMGTIAFFSAGVIPYLSVDDNAAIWKKLGIDRCLPALPQHEKDWLSLFKAVGARDAQSMAREARVLLAGRKKLVGEGGRYLLAAGMLGSVASGDMEGARELWNNFEAGFTAGTEGSITIELLKSLSHP
jgi:hypothetical protein